VAGWNDWVWVDAVVRHLTPFCGHGPKEAESRQCSNERDKDERLPLSQEKAEDFLNGSGNANDVETAKFAQI